VDIGFFYFSDGLHSCIYFCLFVDKVQPLVMRAVYASILVGHVTTHAAITYNRSYRFYYFEEDW
jgi:hypothetical protein